MISNIVYIRIPSSTKAPHWLPHFVSHTLLLQVISYQTYVNGVIDSLHKSKKGLWPLYLLSTGVYKIEKFKHAKEEVSVQSSFKLKDVTFRRHYPQGKLKEYLLWIGFTWSYAREELFPGELSQ